MHPCIRETGKVNRGVCPLPPPPTGLYLTWPAQPSEWLLLVYMVGLATYLLWGVYRSHRAGRTRGDKWWVVAAGFAVGVAAALCVEAVFTSAVMWPAQDRLWAWYLHEATGGLGGLAPSGSEVLSATFARESDRLGALQDALTVPVLITFALAAAGLIWLRRLGRTTAPMRPTVERA